MTMDQVEKLLDYDVRSRMPIVRKLPDYSAYSPELKRRLFGMAYRGSLQQSPKARELMSQGRFDLASDEYLNSDEYKASRDQRPKKGKTDVPGRGVATRMEKDAQMIASEFERLPPGVIGTKQHGPLKPGLESYSEKMANVQAQIPVQTISQQTEPVDNSYYTIGKGDSLSAIAKKHNTTVDALSKLNKINDPNKIQMGQKLRLR
jgi:LysM repeat protein